MKLTTLLALASSSIALATPVQKRADYCGQWDSAVSGDYTIYNVRSHSLVTPLLQIPWLTRTTIEPLGPRRRHFWLAMHRC